MGGGLTFPEIEEPGFLKEGVELPHLGERFDPRPGNMLATGANKRSRQPGSSIRGMDHHTGQSTELPINGLEAGSCPAAGKTKVLVPQTQREWSTGKHTDAYRFVEMPENRDEADNADGVRAVMPPSKIRPVAFRSGGEGQLVEEADLFFFTAGMGASASRRVRCADHVADENVGEAARPES
jgi:hypothetical protein